MARALEDYEWNPKVTKTPKPSKWDKWDRWIIQFPIGTTFLILQGPDFSEDPETIIQEGKSYARRIKVRCNIRLHKESNGGVVVRFTERPQPQIHGSSHCKRNLDLRSRPRLGRVTVIRSYNAYDLA